MNKQIVYICAVIAGVAQLVERQPSKLNVASSNLVSRSRKSFIIMMGLFYFKEFNSVPDSTS